jgi:hypothetical protein
MGDVGGLIFFFFFFLGVVWLGRGAGVCFCQEPANHKAPRSCNELTNGGIKCAMNRALQNSPPLRSHTHALRARARETETERKGRERDTEQVRVCVVRSQMCVL